MRKLVEAGENATQIAECLDQEGFRPPSSRADRFTPERARDLVYRLGLSQRRRPNESLASSATRERQSPAQVSRAKAHHVYEGSRVVRRAAWRGMLKESVCRTCEHLAIAAEACLTRVPCVKGEYAPRINDIRASNNNLRQISDVKPGLEMNGTDGAVTPLPCTTCKGQALLGPNRGYVSTLDGQGGPIMSEHTSLKAFTQFRSLFCSLVFDPELTLGQVTSTKWIAEVVAQEVGKTCDRIFSPLVTLALFLGQVLSDDHSCRAVVLRLLAWRAARGLPKCSADTGGYCKARRRLPDSLLPRLVRESADRHETHQSRGWLFHGRRVVIADGSTASMPDTPANQQAFPQHSNQKRGCGFPIARVVVLLSLATGGVIDAAIGASKGKLTGEHALLRSLHRRLKPGDVLLADAYYSSFDAIMALVQMGVDVVMRQTANRPTDFRQGIQLGREDHLIESAPTSQPVEMDEPRGVRGFAACAADARAAGPSRKARIPDKGIRGRHDPARRQGVPGEQLAGLYRARWHAELDIRSIKQTMKMDVLRCKTPDLVRKEIWAHLLVYNLIRGAMAEAARQHNVMPRQLSLQGARQTLQAFRAELKRVPAKVAAVLCATALEAMAAHRVGDRPDRAEPRVVKSPTQAVPAMQVPRKLARKRFTEAA